MVKKTDRWWPGADLGLTPTGRTPSQPNVQHIAPKTEEVRQIKAAVVKDLSSLGDALRKKE